MLAERETYKLGSLVMEVFYHEKEGCRLLRSVVVKGDGSVDLKKGEVSLELPLDHLGALTDLLESICRPKEECSGEEGRRRAGAPSRPGRTHSGGIH